MGGGFFSLPLQVQFRHWCNTDGFDEVPCNWMEAKDETFLSERIQLVKKTPRPEEPEVQLFLYPPGRPFALKSLFHHNLAWWKGDNAHLHPLHSILDIWDEVTPSLELGTAKGSMASAALVCVPKAARGLLMEDKRLPISCCHRDFNEVF